MPTPWVFVAAGEVVEELGWLTDVLQASATGVSQHRRLRDVPRVHYGFQSMVSGDERRRLEQALRRHAAAEWDVPLLCDRRHLLAPSSGSTLTLAVAGARFATGGRALLVSGDPSASWEVVTLDAVGGGTLTTADPIAGSWAAGTAVLPLRAGRLAEVPALERFTSDDTGVIDLRWRLDEALETAPSLPTTYRGLPVFDLAPVWLSDPQWSPLRLTDGEDNELAPPAVFDLAGLSLDRMAQQYATTTEEELAALRGALYALAGRWSPAWVPSWAKDLRVVADVADGAATLDVAGPLLSAELPANLRDLRIVLADGTVLHRRVSSAAALSASADRLTLDSAIATGFSVGQVQMVSFMRLCVQDADVNALKFFMPGVITTEIVWRGLAHEL